MTSLRQRIALKVETKKWLNDMAETYHYMHRRVHRRACPFGWAVLFDGEH